MCFTVKSFCCFISLQMGAQIISIVITLLSTLITVLYTGAVFFLRLSDTKLIFYLAMAVASGLQCVLAVLLSYGAFKKRPMWMWPWLVLAWTTGTALLLVSVAGTITLILSGKLYPDVNVVIFAYVLYALFLLYCACVVNSRRIELVKELDHKNTEAVHNLMPHPNAWRYV